MSIPKIIHSVWLGGDSKKPDLVRKCEASWRKHLSDWTFMEWNEKNFDFDLCPYARSLYDQKAWGFLSDPMRFKVLKDYGGFYLDSDMMVYKPFEKFLDFDLVMGFMFECALETAIIGCAKGNKIISDLCEFYFRYDGPPVISNSPVTWCFLEGVPGFMLNGRKQMISQNEIVVDRKYFGTPSYHPSKGYAVHIGMGSWTGVSGIPEQKGRVPPVLKKLLRKLLGPVFYGDLHAKYLLRHVHEFYPTYRNHRQGIHENKYPDGLQEKAWFKIIQEVIGVSVK